MSKVCLSLLTISAILLGASCKAKDLPFAPPRHDPPTNPAFLSSFKHEAIYGKLETGWVPGHQINSENQFRLMQFVPKGEEPETATRFVNIATYQDETAKGTALDLMNKSKKEFEKATPRSKAHFDILSSSNPNDVMFEYWVKGYEETPDQYEIQRAIKGQDGVHAIIYHLSKGEMSEEERLRILSWLRKVKLVKTEDLDSVVGGSKETAASVSARDAKAPEGEAPAAKAPVSKAAPKK